MKKLMLLGGAHYLLPVIKAAHELGLYVISCDYLPDNIAHKYSDKYLNVSIIDKDAVLSAAREENIDGIMSFACDPGVTTAAYVAEKMGLPSVGSYEAVSILQNKGRFRAFLRDNGFNVPWAYSFEGLDAALEAKNKFTYPAIVKPVDSAGSKGVSRVDDESGLRAAVEYALKFSFCNNVIIEQFITQQGASSDTDSFSIDGRLCFASFNNQLFDAKADNPYTPAAYTWPSGMPTEVQAELRAEIQRLITLLGLRTSVYNIETRLGTDGKAYIMELSPRGGGNRLCEVLKLACGTDLIKAAVQAAVGMPVEEMSDPVYSGHFAEIILHSDNEGHFRELWISPELEECVLERNLWVVENEWVESFTGANKAIGTLVMNFRTEEELNRYMNETDWYRIVLDGTLNLKGSGQ